MNYNTKLLSIATFLTFATISSFAQRGSNTEVLAHLKQAKSESLTKLYYNKDAMQRSLKGPLDLSPTDFDLIIRLWSDLFSALDPQEKQFDADAAMCLQLLCETQYSIKDILDKAPEYGMGKTLISIGQVISSENKNLNDQEIKNNYKTIISVFMKHMNYPEYKHFKDDYLNNLNPVIVEKIESCSMCEDFWEMGIIGYETKVLEKLLPKLEAKIKELEA
jgi:hypothetical protein